MLRAHPSSIRFSADDHDRDDNSELTGPSGIDDHWQDDDLGINMAADPYYYHNVGGVLPSSPEKRELLELKVQLARQQEKLEDLSSTLSRCIVENEALEAEKAILADELALVMKEQTMTKREEQRTSGSTPKEGVGPIRQLVDLNAALTTENAQLQAAIDATRRSFNIHIKESRRRGDEDKKTIEALRLRRKNELLQLHQSRSECKNLRLSLSERTAKTSLRSSFTQSIMEGSLEPGPVLEVNFGTSGDEWITEGEEIETADNAHVRERAPRSSGKTVDHTSSKDTKQALTATRDGSKGSGVDESRWRPTWMGRRHSTDEIARSEAEDLLVSFGEAQRSTARGWSNLKW